jgi:hypothetical protein
LEEALDRSSDRTLNDDDDVQIVIYPSSFPSMCNHPNFSALNLHSCSASVTIISLSKICMTCNFNPAHISSDAHLSNGNQEILSWS